ncbi:MAG: hypothetical protein ACI4F1_01345 [Bariatricus sp.]
MAVKTKKQSKKIKIGGKKQNVVPRNLPDKRTINFVGVGEKPINVKIAVPGVVIIVLAAVIFSKFAVVDRLVAVSKAQSEAAVVKAQLDAGYQKIEEYGEMADDYAHYTYSGMTSEELNQADRVEVLNLIRRVVLSQSGVSSWSIQGNQMSLSIGGSTLQKINLIVQQLEADDLVDFCTVTTASTNDRGTGSNTVTGANEVVTAEVTIYLSSGLKEGE